MNIEELINHVKAWAINNQFVEALLLVGSYANGKAKEDSDIDFVIVSNTKAELISDYRFVHFFGIVDSINVEEYGACTSVRVFYNDGLEVEFGAVCKTWLNKPLDNGTRTVLENGYRIILDKKNLLDKVLD